MDELETKLFWHLLPQCANRVLRHVQDKFGGLPQPELFLQECEDWAPEPLRHKIKSYLKNPDKKFSALLESAVDIVGSQNIGWIERGADGYPELLAQIPDAPALLYYRGSLCQVHTPQIAIVGSRACSRSGQRDASVFAARLSSSGFTITSGLALGIDTSAHLGTLESSGTTVAVIGSGFDKIYPARNQGLAEQIVGSGGLMLTEFPPGTPPRRENFPQRNRIISGLSLATLVIEASNRSGSLITARLALEQGREVMVLPGSIHDSLKDGCHRLIRDGATLVHSPQQIVEQLGSLLGFQQQLLEVTGEKNREAAAPERSPGLLKHIEFEPITTDELVELTGLSALLIAEELTELELCGLIERSAKGFNRTG